MAAADAVGGLHEALGDRRSVDDGGRGWRDVCCTYTSRCNRLSVVVDEIMHHPSRVCVPGCSRVDDEDVESSRGQGRLDGVEDVRGHPPVEFRDAVTRGSSAVARGSCCFNDVVDGAFGRRREADGGSDGCSRGVGSR